MRILQKRRGWMFLILIPALAVGEQTIPPNRLFALVNEGRISLAVGRFDAVKHWMPSTAFYDPPQPQDRFTIYGMKGKLGEVRITDPRRPLPEDTFANWYPKVSPWNWTEQPQAFAIAGPLPDLSSSAETLPLDNPEAVAVASDYLRSKGLQVPHPFLTQVFEVNLGKTLGKGLLICAHSDESALRDDTEAAIYAVALVRLSIKGKNKTIPLASQTSFKPAHQTIEQHKASYGTRDFYRYIACLDLNGDGRPEIVLYRAQFDATVVDVYEWEGTRPAKVLSAYASTIL